MSRERRQKVEPVCWRRATKGPGQASFLGSHTLIFQSMFHQPLRISSSHILTYTSRPHHTSKDFNHCLRCIAASGGKHSLTTTERQSRKHGFTRKGLRKRRPFIS